MNVLKNIFLLTLLTGCAASHNPKMVQEAARYKIVQITNSDQKTIGTGFIYNKNNDL